MMIDIDEEAEMKSREWRRTYPTLAAVLSFCLAGQGSFAGPFRDRVARRRAARVHDELDQDQAAFGGPASLPAGVEIVRDVPYGIDARQRFDVYRTAQAHDAPVIFMVHGGAWRLGDKSMRRVVEGKVTHWVPMGFVFISTNYRLLSTDPIEQARDVAQALAVAQNKAAEWGADRGKFILMGHSAGAHLIMLVATSRSLSSSAGTTTWLGEVSLDSGAMDVVEIMEGRHPRFYDRAFGHDPDFWRSASPFYTLTATTRPVLVVCSTRRADSCGQARRFAAKARSLSVTVTVLEKNLSHGEINERLGQDPTYTTEVDAFLARLDNGVATRLAR
jgi:arylformamidase